MRFFVLATLISYAAFNLVVGICLTLFYLLTKQWRNIRKAKYLVLFLPIIGYGVRKYRMQPEGKNKLPQKWFIYKGMSQINLWYVLAFTSCYILWVQGAFAPSPVETTHQEGVLASIFNDDNLEAAFDAFEQLVLMLLTPVVAGVYYILLVVVPRISAKQYVEIKIEPRNDIGPDN